MDILSARLKLADWLVKIKKAKHTSQIAVIKGRYNDNFEIFNGKNRIGNCVYCPFKDGFTDIKLYK